MDRESRYQNILKTAKYTFDNYPMDEIGKMAIMATILKMEFSEWIFCGFYRVIKPNLLEIGPYQGNILACGHIAFDRGVCGTSASEKKTIIVDDVSTFPGYIACDEKTVSEIVVPVIKNDGLIAVLDIDGDRIGQFNRIDQLFLEKLVCYI